MVDRHRGRSWRGRDRDSQEGIQRPATHSVLCWRVVRGNPRERVRVQLVGPLQAKAELHNVHKCDRDDDANHNDDEPHNNGRHDNERHDNERDDDVCRTNDPRAECGCPCALGRTDHKLRERIGALRGR